MSIQKCSQCKASYWRFRGDHPPKGVCSVPCAESRKVGKHPEEPLKPEAILRRMMEHRSLQHGSSDILAWFDCPICEELEKLYGESLQYHYDEITKDIVKEARA